MNFSKIHMNTTPNHYESWKRSEFEALPQIDDRTFDYINTRPECFIIVPNRKKHDSGYRIMDIVIVVDEKPIGRFSGVSDAIQLGKFSPVNWCWQVDSLPTSGLIRFWTPYKKHIIVSSYSTFEVCSEDTIGPIR